MVSCCIASPSDSLSDSIMGVYENVEELEEGVSKSKVQILDYRLRNGVMPNHVPFFLIDLLYSG